MIIETRISRNHSLHSIVVNNNILYRLLENIERRIIF